MSIFQTNISLLNKFLKQFSTCFSKKQLAVFTLLIYALFKDYKRNSLDAMAKATHTYNLQRHTPFILKVSKLKIPSQMADDLRLSVQI